MINYEAELKNLAYRLSFDQTELNKHPEMGEFLEKRINKTKDRISEIIVAIYSDGFQEKERRLV